MKCANMSFFKNISKLARHARIVNVRYCCKWCKPVGTDTGIKIYSPVAKEKVPLIIKDNLATWYSCGPTVYDSAHVGHASCYVKLDLIQRIIRNYFHINLITAMGVTDIDDKIIKRCNILGIEPSALTQKYESEFWKNLKDLNVVLPDIILRVSDHVSTIEEFVKVLFENKMCYVGADNSVYFDIAVYGKYNKLIKNHQNDDEDTAIKKSSQDFALWKACKKGEPYWETQFGKGRPGWHVECSAMVTRVFGSNVDFHAGGIDLLFPHHENEEAQSCAYHNIDQWVNYWVHTGHLSSNEVKMSKSLKNTVSIDELLNRHPSDIFRIACLLSHYRNSMEYDERSFANAEAVLQKLKFFIEDCRTFVNDPQQLKNGSDSEILDSLKSTIDSIDERLRDDFDTAGCFAIVTKLMKITRKKMNDESCGTIEVALVRRYLLKLFDVFGLSIESRAEAEGDHAQIINAAIDFRNRVREEAIALKNRNLFASCDIFRDELKRNKIFVNDQKLNK